MGGALAIETGPQKTALVPDVRADERDQLRREDRGRREQVTERAASPLTAGDDGGIPCRREGREQTGIDRWSSCARLAIPSAPKLPSRLKAAARDGSSLMEPRD